MGCAASVNVDEPLITKQEKPHHDDSFPPNSISLGFSNTIFSNISWLHITELKEKYQEISSEVPLRNDWFLKLLIACAMENNQAWKFIFSQTTEEENRFSCTFFKGDEKIKITVDMMIPVEFHNHKNMIELIGDNWWTILLIEKVFVKLVSFILERHLQNYTNHINQLNIAL